MCGSARPFQMTLISLELQLESFLHAALEDCQLPLIWSCLETPWNYGCASLGHRLVHAKRVVPPPAVTFDGSLRLPDKDAKAVQDYAYAKAHPSRMLTKLQFLGCWDKLSSRRMVSKNPFSMSRGWKRP